MLKYFTDKELSMTCESVSEEEDVAHIIEELQHTLENSSNGLAIAANQIGYNKRIIIVPDGDSTVAMINPEIISTSDKTELSKEGCLSIPKIFFNIKRYTKVLVSWEDKDRNFIHGTFDGRDGHCVQHEVDHLNGKTIFDHLPTSKRRLKVKKALRELKKMPV